MESRAERAAKNEALFREVNERTSEVVQGYGGGMVVAFCECSAPECTETVELTLEEYEAVRARGDRFALRASHEDLEIERVVERNERFIVIEKLGEGADLARGLDPRA